jgi:hypothetical protein
LVVPIEELRGGKLDLSQPAEAGWHFYAEDRNPERASDLATAWAMLFQEKVRENIANSDGLNSFIEVNATQTENLPVERSASLSSYLLTGAVFFLVLASIGFLFFSKSR